ncbi:MurR/RpiR family transcriptional regulator [Oceanobacillus polygoni]|uniref:DNA-binding MurR/RpiR family transcriptional regulator n=1 Tax=Oceanobacillus polygoni TaxID=1235259 RepID=A0A9X0YQD5_9BACI|nr:MurR/RpiR family transcriptional regulator [Oceanobacillus polygoni]MBP2076146.1 DNA-binding MurR/RpiR family transcriptional regulator [Oceanobacillus polygoni]
MNFKNRIQKYNSSLTDNDKKITKYLLANKASIRDKTIIDLSEEIQVSPASITRFCKKIDFNTFQQMKFSLIGSSTENKKNDETFETVYNYYQTIIKSTQQFFSEEQTSKIVNLILNTNKILFCGIGNSGLVAHEFNSRIYRMGIASESVTDAHDLLMKSSLLQENDLLVCFSNTGKTKPVIDSAKIAKANKTTVIVVTNFEQTALTELADEVVLISSYKYIDDTRFINSQLPGLFLLDLLTYKLLNHEKLMHARNKTLEAIHKYS